MKIYIIISYVLILNFYLIFSFKYVLEFWYDFKYDLLNLHLCIAANISVKDYSVLGIYWYLLVCSRTPDKKNKMGKEFV